MSNYKLHEASGHRYFSLKDEGAQIRVALFRGRDRHIYGEIRDGQSVIVTGSLGVYEKKGEYQVYAQSVEVRGVGNLLVELERQEAEAGGRRAVRSGEEAPPSPVPPADRDRHVPARRRAPRHGARGAVAVPGRRDRPRARPRPGRGRGGGHRGRPRRDVPARRADVIIAGRGGGSIEDLWAFNEEEVVRALARSPVPTISAVGHETDFTLSDLAADLRAPTPTGAAQMAVPDRVELLERVAALSLRLRRTEAHLRETARREWRIAAGMLSDPRPLLQGKRYALGEQEASLAESARSAVRERRERLERLSSSVRIHSPAAWVSARRGEVAVLSFAGGGRDRPGSAVFARGSTCSPASSPSWTRRRSSRGAIPSPSIAPRGRRSDPCRRPGPGGALDILVSDGAFGAVVEGKKT